MNEKIQTKHEVDVDYFQIKPYKPFLSNFLLFPFVYLAYGHHPALDVFTILALIFLIWWVFIKEHGKYFKIGIMTDRVDLYDEGDKVVKTCFFDDIHYVENIHTDNYVIFMKSGESFNTGYIQADNDEIRKIFHARAVDFVSKDIGSI